MENLFLLPTDKPSRLIIHSTLLNEFRLLDKPIEDWKHKKNIYITNDEKPKLNDWFLDTIDKVVFKVTYEDILTTQLDGLPSNFKKIILTTDQDLINDGVQAIDDEFLEWFVKNPSCEEVGIEPLIAGFVDDEPSYYENMYDIIIPKEEFKKKHIVMLVGNEASDLETKIIECLKEADDKLDANDFSRLAESIIDYVDEIARSKKNVV
jgi:hypothetical protein